MAGERGLHGDLGRLHIANLPHQDPVGILPQDGPQAGGEGVADLGIDRHLDDPVDVVFHRVFGGDQFVFDQVEFGEGRVERGGLARAGGTGHEHDPVGPLDHLAKLPQHRGLQPNLLQVEGDHAPVEHPHHHTLAEQRGEHAHAEIDRMAAHGQLDPTVLRHPPLGDVEVGHHLDSGGDRKGQMLGRRHHLLEHTIRLDADPEFSLEGLEVDVARAVADRQQEHHVEQLPHRGALRQGLHAREVGRPFPESGRRCLGGQILILLEVLDQRFNAVGV